MSTPSPQPGDDATQEENRRLRDRIAALERDSALSASAPWLSPLLDNAPIGIGVLDDDFHYLAVNRWLAAMNGVPAAEHIGRTLDEVAPFIADQARQAFRRVVETRLPVADQEVCTLPASEPGQRRYYSLTWFPVEGRSGAAPAVGVAVTEITARKQSEEAYRQREAALLQANQEIEALYRNAPAGMALVDAEFRYRQMNQRMAEIDGVKLPDVPRADGRRSSARVVAPVGTALPRSFRTPAARA